MTQDPWLFALGFGLFTLLVAVLALALWGFNQRRKTEAALKALTEDMVVSNGAAYNVGRTLQTLEAAVYAMDAGSRAGDGVPDAKTLANAMDLIHQGADNDELADVLEVSRTEARLMSHLSHLAGNTGVDSGPNRSGAAPR